MTKSKAKSLAIRSGQGDFQLQSKRCPTSHTARVQSRSCSLVQSPSPTSIPPRSKVAFADFVNFSSDAKVSSPRRKKPMSISGSPAPSSHCPSSGGHTSGSSGNSRAIPLNSDHHEVRRGEAKASSSRLCSKHVAPSPTPVQGHPSVTCPTEGSLWHPG
ncbi:hypothetical protein NC651_010772 [Populus alba x Populus x berolinensis]|nr:hypothetical protein NC651_010772 [Populus alba x Populus x berolinensis]